MQYFHDGKGHCEIWFESHHFLGIPLNVLSFLSKLGKPIFSHLMGIANYPSLGNAVFMDGKGYCQIRFETYRFFKVSINVF